jgi:prevent-host-death family protein
VRGFYCGIGDGVVTGITSGSRKVLDSLSSNASAFTPDEPERAMSGVGSASVPFPTLGATEGSDYNVDSLDRNFGGECMSWQLEEAKQRFSELVRRAEREGPQFVTRHGEEVVVVVPAEEWRRVSGDGEEKMSFKEFLMSGPDLSVLDLERPKEMPRDIEL